MIKWGILGAGHIAGKFASDFRFVNEDSKIVAVAARSADRAADFATQYHIERSYGSYVELVEDKEVDVIYIATTHNFHLEHILLCLEHGKHVLCEKPATVNLVQFETARAEAGRRGLFFMEAMWTVFLPAILKAKEWVASGRIGDLRLVQASLGFCLDLSPERRIVNPALAAGALLDLGIYPLHLGQWFAQSEVADFQVMASLHDSGVDLTDLMQVRYRNGVWGQYAAGSTELYENKAILVGSKGRIVIDDFNKTKKAVLKIGDHEEAFLDSSPGFGYYYEVRSVIHCLERHLTQNPDMPLEQSAQVLGVMDLMRGRMGVRYPFE